MGSRVSPREYGVSESNGFLPDAAPLTRLPGRFAEWDEIGAVLPKHLAAGRARELLSDVAPLDPATLTDPAERERAMLLLSYFGHAYIFGGDEPAGAVPANIAVPWHCAAGLLGRPPVLSYATQQLHNWGRLTDDPRIELGNIHRLQGFLGGMDDDWFVLVHVAIEAAAAPVLRASIAAQDAVLDDDGDALTRALGEIAAGLGVMSGTLARMPERCDPYIYYNRVRSYLFGWDNNPALPDGIVYEGVDAYGGRPQRFGGETGAQSAIIPFLDEVLGLAGDDDPLAAYMHALRAYIPPGHRAFIEKVGPRVDLRGFLLRHRPAGAVDAYDACVTAMADFRELHLRYAAMYVHKQAQRSAANSTAVGTGGTPFMRYLKGHLDTVRAHRIGAAG
ncbi:hypothetical protein [Streptomyces sp. NBC_00525]|uniref:hypothetical protein n=1 Tax=Streptomyces sp. NBC_00525 TaxID=2903660 RepID=UPI002E80D4D0|nr:hypothetical protein [Streptomyces sp. NBC_00525]WUC95435.1 indoleamine 2,3-dioxygenase [Streptomyces sp. NBC_00525]